MDIASENDHMKEDAEMIHEKYKSKLVTLDEAENEIKAKLEERTTELEEETKSARMLLFDAKVQCKSNEISDATFDSVKICTNEVIERVSHEIAEIKNVKSRISDLELEVQEITAPSQPNVQESAVSYLEIPEQQQVVQTILPEAPIVSKPQSSEPIRTETLPIPESPTESEVSAEFPDPPKQVTPETPKDNDNDWLARMEVQ